MLATHASLLRAAAPTSKRSLYYSSYPWISQRLATSLSSSSIETTITPEAGGGADDRVVVVGGGWKQQRTKGSPPRSRCCRTGPSPSSSSSSSLSTGCWATSSPPAHHRRFFGANAAGEPRPRRRKEEEGWEWSGGAGGGVGGGNGGEEKDEESEATKASSNRAAFKATPVIPSILAHIERVGVGIRPKRRRKKYKGTSDVVAGGRGGGGGGARNRGGGGGDTLDEEEELDYFNESERHHRLQSREKRGELRGAGGKRRPSLANNGNGAEPPAEEEVGGAYWLPPPPFSASSAGGPGGDDGRTITRRPVKLLGTAGSLDDDSLPRETIGLSEVAIAGRSNVGKSTLLNALLYGNMDASLAPRKYRRGTTPDGAKLPRGVKAVTSAKPGETKELSFYQLTADVVGGDGNGDGGGDRRRAGTAKMSLLMVDLPGYGFAFAKAERTKEWRDLMHYYLLERRSLKRILLLLDARHGFKRADFEFLGELQDGLMAKPPDDGTTRRRANRRELPPIQIVLTKCDLVKQSDLARRVVVVRRQLSDFLIREPSSLPVMLVSARPGLGFNNLRGEVPLGGVLELQRELASLVPLPRRTRGGSRK